MFWNSNKYLWIPGICVCFLLFCSYYFNSSPPRRAWKKPKSESISKFDQGFLKRKLILDWTTFFGSKLSDSPTLDKLKCPISSCDLTNKRSMLEVSDAVVFHWRDVNLQDMPKKGKKQRWILRNYENPFHVSNPMLALLEDSIDWTVSYRRDSDVPSYYGLILSRNASNPRSRNVTDPPPVPVIDRKCFSQKKPIAWMVSNCDSRSQRNYLASELKKSLDVDIYGKCHGGDSSLRRISRGQAFKKLSDKYKLYLSFENALCRDYATEKVFLPLHYGLIPVVWGAANYATFLPPNSYIDVKNFSTIAELASHLKKVIEDYDLYSSYFEWRKDYYVPSLEIPPTFLCDICARLYVDRDYVKRNVTLTSWWNLDNDCVKVPNLTFALPPLRDAINELYTRK